ncbi:conserved hypothetical protein [Pseudomonas sp. 9AZ]|uniref:hypothetical protein n=1 Tax=Pseudomonas sp. 9AZ TaxID=2653168 RepID=UPI0012F0A4A1|nr:hypothetical protein [Pseudomonas sp. 9AZ]VXD00142.1 conserved hypothetical protein [Pseudomonas sp. 9AZ]
MTTSPINWPELVFDPVMMAHIDRMASRRFPTQALAEEAGTYVIEHLAHDDWNRCRQFNGSAKPETFLKVVISRALEDFSHKKFGKPRPPVWLKNQGQMWVTVWKMVCLERQMPESVKQAMSTINSSLEDISDIIRTIKARLPWCGEVTLEIQAPATDDNEFSVDEFGSTCSLEQMNDNQQQQSWLLFLAALLNHCDVTDSTESITRYSQLPLFKKKLQIFNQHLALSHEERLLLTLVYQENYKLTNAAKVLGLAEHQPTRVLKKIHQRIESGLAQLGMSLDELKAIFSDDIQTV